MQKIKNEKITLDKFLLFFTFFFFMAYTLFSYIGDRWVPSSAFSQSLTQLGNTGTFVKMLLFGAFVCFAALVITQCLNQKVTPFINFLLIVLTLFGFFWTIYSILVDNVTILVLLRDPFPPFALLLPLGILIGMKDKFWDSIKKYIFACALILIYASLISAIMFFINYGTSHRPTSGGMVYWFYKGFFLLFATILFTDEWKKKYKPLVLITILVMFFVAAILQSRSWFIQNIILFITFLFTAKNRRESNILTIILSVFSLIIFFALNGEAFDGLINRFNNSGDTRTGQLSQFFEQVGLGKLFLGQGVLANYTFGSQSSFKFIDNQILLSLFRFGFIPTISYIVLLLYPIIRSIDEKNKKCFKQSFLLVVWMLAMLGLSVYFNLSFEIAGFVIFIMSGRIIAQLYAYRSSLWRKNVV